MFSRSSIKLNFLYGIVLLLLIQPAFGQDSYKSISNKIDSLANIGLPKSALAEIDKLDALAHANNNTPQQVKAAIYRMTFQSYLEENALVAVINGLKADVEKATFPVKPVLQSLLAETYWKYYQQNRYQFSQRSRLEIPDDNFINWDIQTIISETGRLYQASIAELQREQNTPVSILDGVLIGDAGTRNLRPTLYDLLVQRALDFYLTEESELVKPKLAFTLNNAALFGDSRAFANLNIPTTDTLSNYYRGIKYLQQATLFHLKNNQPEAVADIDLQRLRFLFGKATVNHKDSLYISALQQVITTFADKPISNKAYVFLGQYYQGIDSLNIARSFYKKAVDAYPESIEGKNAGNYIDRIDEKTISASVEEANSPGKPLLTLLNYKNIVTAKVVLYHLSANQFKEYEDLLILNWNNRTAATSDFIKTLTALQTRVLILPNNGDYRQHTAEFKIDPLTTGNYLLLVKDSQSDDESLTGVSTFKVSRLAYVARINPDEKMEVRVVDRETGEPISGVKINLSGKVRKYISNVWELVDVNDKGVTNSEGLFITGKEFGNDLNIELDLKGDILTGHQYLYGAKAVADDDDDPDDKTILFTDRQIYRPGQTIYFKGLQLQVFKDKNKIVPGKNVEISFNDVNQKEIGTLTLKTNEFGTFSGSFIIPQNMLGGDVELETDDGSIRVKVEEYKRPTFQVEFLPVKGSYKLNDSVTVKGTVKAFSGYGISRAKLAFHIMGLGNRTYYPTAISQLRNINMLSGSSLEIMADTILTDDSGNFVVKFKSAPNITKGNYTYGISADVTDASGETRSAQTSVTVGNNNILINAAVPAMVLATDSVINIPVSINNLNSQPQKGEVTVQVNALQNAPQLFKARLWRKPDRYILSKADFKRDFPEFAYGNEDEYTTWNSGRTVDSLHLNVSDDKTATIHLTSLVKQQPGIYRVIINARNAQGDTVSVTGFVKLAGEGAAPVKFDNWVVPVVNAVKPGGNAEFLAGADASIHVLMERYNAAKLISSKWLTLQKGQQSIKLPVSKDKDAAVQFMMVYQNRAYSSYQKIYNSNPDEQLQLKLLTFRNKLQPGEKEQWKLQVSNNNDEKHGAEMLAELYDASLDDITTPQDWENALEQRARYQPNYFAWTSNGFVNQVSTSPLAYKNQYYNPLTRNYERLDLFGYNYYGGYNSNYRNYLQRVKVNLTVAERDRQLENDYLKNAVLVKDGYDITGKVVDDKGEELIGVTIQIKGTGITTTTNSKGMFKIKVPAKGALVFRYVGYKTNEITTTKSENLSVSLKADESSLNEVVVVGYGAQKRSNLTGTLTTVRLNGKDFLGAELQGKVAGVVVEDVNKVYDSISIRGQRSIGGQSTNDPITIRKNFNETAFFYPQLRTDSKGQILIEFTIPEALTKWRFKAFAHTKNLQTGYIANEIVTQKQLSISANMPRFLREGDTITVSARLANLTSGQLKGKVNLQLFNGLTMQPVSLLQSPADADQDFEMGASATKAVSFKLIVPPGLDALTYRLTASANKYSDGEENTVPVLSNRMLVTETMPMMVRAGQNRTFNFDKLLNNKSTTLKSKTLTLEYTQNPAWYAVQAIPYLMEFEYECSEQIFSRYYANSLASNLVNTMPVIKRVFDQWKSSNSTALLSNLEKNEDLKATLLAETPWLCDAASEADQKKRIALLFDLNKMSNEMQMNLDKLQKRQLPDGDFPWFAGDRADRYITQHILAGIGQLYLLNIVDDKNQNLKTIKDKALSYLDAKLIEDDDRAKKLKGYETREVNPTEIHAWYARSYYVNTPMSAALKSIFNNYLQRATRQWVAQDVFEQGMIGLTMSRNKEQGVAAAIIKSLGETAQRSDDMGMYWSKNQSGYYWYQSPIETQSLLIEFFTAAGNTKDAEEMKIWLLRNKQTGNWKTTKATAAACYALLSKQSDWLSTDNATRIKVDKTLLDELKPDIKADAGTGYIKTNWADAQIKPGLGNVEVNNTGQSISWGAMYWQYLEQMDKITPSKTDIQLERKYYILRQTASGPVSIAVDASHQPNVGDVIKAIIYLKAGREFEYIQLKDMRPAGTEPVNVLSQYKQQDGLYYYEVTKDVATNFFISQLNKGNYVFEYQLRVTQPGNFSTGITTVQCMYAPEFNVNSTGLRINVNP